MQVVEERSLRRKHSAAEVTVSNPVRLTTSLLTSSFVITNDEPAALLARPVQGFVAINADAGDRSSRPAARPRP